MRTLAPPPVNADGEEMAPEIALMSRVVEVLPGTDFSDYAPAEARTIIEQEALAVADRFPPFEIEEDLVLPGDCQRRGTAPAPPAVASFSTSTVAASSPEAGPRRIQRSGSSPPRRASTSSRWTTAWPPSTPSPQL